METAIRDAELQLLQASNRLEMARVTLESARNRHEVAVARDAADYHRYRLERDLAQQTSGTIVAMGGQPPPVTPYNPTLKLDAAQALREYELAQKTFEAETASLEFARQTCALQVERAKATFVAKTRNAAPQR